MYTTVLTKETSSVVHNCFGSATFSMDGSAVYNFRLSHHLFLFTYKERSHCFCKLLWLALAPFTFLTRDCQMNIWCEKCYFYHNSEARATLVVPILNHPELVVKTSCCVIRKFVTLFACVYLNVRLKTYRSLHHGISLPNIRFRN